MIHWLKHLLAGNELRELDYLRAEIRDITERLKRPSRIVTITDWDIAQSAEQSEPDRIDYRFLGVTGEEEA